MFLLRLAKPIAAVLALTFVGVDPWVVVEAQVPVRGYFRKDGTPVRPHYRSYPNGNFYDNWSTKGNVNPYTGKPGTKKTPPAGYGADVPVDGYLRRNGSYVAPHYRSAPDGDPSNNWSTKGNYNPYTGNLGTRYVAPPSSEVGRGGFARFSGYSNDSEMRIRKANDLAVLGHSVDWQQHSWLEMRDIESRIKIARDLAVLGHSVDWQQHSWLEMRDVESRIRKARDLSRFGLDVDWREYSWLEMIEMERNARTGKHNQETTSTIKASVEDRSEIAASSRLDKPGVLATTSEKVRQGDKDLPPIEESEWVDPATGHDMRLYSDQLRAQVQRRTESKIAESQAISRAEGAHANASSKENKMRIIEHIKGLYSDKTRAQVQHGTEAKSGASKNLSGVEDSYTATSKEKMHVMEYIKLRQEGKLRQGAAVASRH